MTIGIYFLGVCTHVWWDKALPAFTKRVVLVNALDDTPIGDKTIRSHVATLRIAAGEVIETRSIVLPEPIDGIIQLQLNGVRMRIANTTEDAWRDDSFGHCLPSLDQLSGGIGAPSKAVVDDGRADLASCIFSVTGGRMQAASNDKGAAFGFLRSETNGNPVVQITPFGSETTGEIELSDSAQITISNLGVTETHDDDWDFYLHYKLAATMPRLELPPPSPCRGNNTTLAATWPPGFKSVGPGCSNSAYP